jgi:NAD(P)-dependent dehydrogenase (short-subunit alcohol dehydrogenase family)
VTGGGSGLGRAISLKLASHGCHVAIADIDFDAANKTALDVMQIGPKAKAYKVDVTNASDIICLRDEITKEFGAVDIVINNAGIIAASNLLDDDATKIEMMVKVNLLGPLLVWKFSKNSF